MFDPVELNRLRSKRRQAIDYPEIIASQRLYHVESITGKTIKKVVKNSDIGIILTFTDDTWIFIEIDASAVNEQEAEYVEFNFYSDPTFHDLIGSDLLTSRAIAEYSKVDGQYRKAIAKRDEESEKQRYFELKEKYEESVRDLDSLRSS